MTLSKEQQAMKDIADEMVEFLIIKNLSYGNSAFQDVSFNGKIITAKQGIEARIVDKIKRIMSGKSYNNEDSLKDLLGYLIIYLANEKLTNEDKFDFTPVQTC